MAMRVLIIGGYGNLGSCIAAQLSKDEDIQLIIAGRNLQRAETMAAWLNQTQLSHSHRVRAERVDIHDAVFDKLFEIKPMVVIHTAGPFREQGYQVASACMEIGAHYIDVATDPGFVGGMVGLRNSANDKGVLVVSGASAKPCLLAAVMRNFQKKFETLEALEYSHVKSLSGLRGVATLADILAAVGAPIKALHEGREQTEFGSQRLRLYQHKGLGQHLLANCSVTLPEVFQGALATCRVFEGAELKLMQVKLWLLSWPVRFRLIPNLEKIAPWIRRLLALVSSLDSATDIHSVVLKGVNKQRGEDGEEELAPSQIRIDVVGKSGDGIYLQCIPAVILTRKLLHDEIQQNGVVPCVGLVSLKEYIDATKELNIAWKSGT